MCPLTFPLVIALVLTSFSKANSPAIPNATYLGWDGISNSSLSRSLLGGMDDPRFSMRILYGHTDIPLIPTFMNAVELMAQYAEMDNLARVGQRHGVVLPNYPEVEIAVIPALPAKTVEVRLILWAMYGTMVDMVSNKMFKECEVPVSWSAEVVAYVYFTIPLDDDPTITNQPGSLPLPTSKDTTDFYETSSITTTQNYTNTGQFSWQPIFKPDGKPLLHKDVFLLSMGVLKAIGIYPATEKVDGPLNFRSELVDANLQLYLQDRRVPRTRPPYFQYAHVIETVRRIPGWMLEKKRFAEFYCSVIVTGRPVGQVVMDKGQYTPGLAGLGGNVSVS